MTEGDRSAKIRGLECDVERCKRILAQTSVVQRLPDRGAKLETRLAQLKKDLESLTISAEAAPSLCGEAASKSECPPAAATGASSSPPSHGRSEEDEKKFLLEMGEKYKHFRVDARDELKKTFRSQLCEEEVARMCSAVEPNYLLSYDETIKMEKEIADFLRREELQAMKRKNNPAK